MPQRGPGLPQPPAAPTRRKTYAPGQEPVYTKVVEGLGWVWGAFPWLLFLAMIGLNVVVRTGHVQNLALAGLLVLVSVVADGLLVIWLVFDVMYNQAPWWWVLVALFCPFGFLIYWFMGRQGA